MLWNADLQWTASSELIPAKEIYEEENKVIPWIQFFLISLYITSIFLFWGLWKLILEILPSLSSSRHHYEVLSLLGKFRAPAGDLFPEGRGE